METVHHRGSWHSNLEESCREINLLVLIDLVMERRRDEMELRHQVLRHQLRTCNRETNLWRSSGLRQQKLIKSGTRQLKLVMTERLRRFQRLRQRSCSRVLVNQFDGVVRFKVVLMEISMETINGLFATDDFQITPRTIICDRRSRSRVLTVLSQRLSRSSWSSPTEELRRLPMFYSELIGQGVAKQSSTGANCEPTAWLVNHQLFREPYSAGILRGQQQVKVRVTAVVGVLGGDRVVFQRQLHLTRAMSLWSSRTAVSSPRQVRVNWCYSVATSTRPPLRRLAEFVSAPYRAPRCVRCNNGSSRTASR